MLISVENISGRNETSVGIFNLSATLSKEEALSQKLAESFFNMDKDVPVSWGKSF